MQMRQIKFYLAFEVFQQEEEELASPEFPGGVQRLAHRILVHMFRPDTGAEYHLHIQVLNKVLVQVEGSAGSEAVTHEEQQALGVGNEEMAFLREMRVKELEEPISLEEGGEDRVMPEGEMGAVKRLDNLFHGTSKNGLTAYRVSIYSHFCQGLNPSNRTN